MQFVSSVESIVSSYIQQYDKHPSGKVTRFIEGIIRFGEKLEELGQSHARENRAPIEAGYFQKSVHGIDDPETACSIAEYYQLCYEDGYAHRR